MYLFKLDMKASIQSVIKKITNFLLSVQYEALDMFRSYIQNRIKQVKTGNTKIWGSTRFDPGATLIHCMYLRITYYQNDATVVSYEDDTGVVYVNIRNVIERK